MRHRIALGHTLMCQSGTYVEVDSSEWAYVKPMWNRWGTFVEPMWNLGGTYVESSRENPQCPKALCKLHAWDSPKDNISPVICSEGSSCSDTESPKDIKIAMHWEWARRPLLGHIAERLLKFQAWNIRMKIRLVVWAVGRHAPTCESLAVSIILEYLRSWLCTRRLLLHKHGGVGRQSACAHLWYFSLFNRLFPCIHYWISLHFTWYY